MFSCIFVRNQDIIELIPYVGQSINNKRKENNKNAIPKFVRAMKPIPIRNQLLHNVFCKENCNKKKLWIHTRRWKSKMMCILYVILCTTMKMKMLKIYFFIDKQMYNNTNRTVSVIVIHSINKNTHKMKWICFLCVLQESCILIPIIIFTNHYLSVIDSIVNILFLQLLWAISFNIFLFDSASSLSSTFRAEYWLYFLLWEKKKPEGDMFFSGLDWLSQ